MARKTRVFPATIVCAAALMCGACASHDVLESGAVPAVMDLHGIEPAPGPDKYEFFSISNIGRDAGSSAPPAPTLPVVHGAEGGWTWDVRADARVQVQVGAFASTRTVSISGASGSRQITIPSWSSAFGRVRDALQMVLGPDIPPLQAELDIYPDGTSLYAQKPVGSDSGIALDFMLSIPAETGTDGGEAYSWMADMLGMTAHEYWHAYNYQNHSHARLNMMTEEATAYTLETCVKLAVLDGQADIHLTDVGGQAVVIADLERQREKQQDSGGPGELSNKARLISIYNIASLLQANVLHRDDVAGRRRIFGLCRAMVRHPVDLTQGFYPMATVTEVTPPWEESGDNR